MSIRETIAHLSLYRRELSGDSVVYYYPENGEYVPLSSVEAHQLSAEVAMGLWDLGARKGARVAVVSNTRQEWSTLDQAILSFGGVVVGIYPTSTPDQVAYILQHSQTSIAVLEDEAQLEKIAPFLPTLTALEQIVLIDSPAGDPSSSTDWISFDELRQRGQALLEESPHLPDECLEAVQPDDMATLVYTSGTTGAPKGVVLTHSKLYNIAACVSDFVDISEQDVGLIYLPMAHILQRVNTYIGLHSGIIGYFAEEMTKVMETCRVAEPTTFSAVPRIYEKIHARITAGIALAPPEKQPILQDALATGYERSRLIQQKQSVPEAVEQKYQKYYELIFSKWWENIFGRRIRYCTSGAAPISLEILEFFHATGILILEGYGLTETSSPITLNHPDNFKFGTVGPPLPGSSIKIAEDGEILAKGPGVFNEYYKNPQATRAAFTEDGWFYTGDIGELDEEGFLRITDRKKNLIITAAGKNIAPANIENLIMNDPHISQVMVHGDKRKHLVALMTLDEEAITNWAQAQQKGHLSLSELSQDQEVNQLVADAVEQANQELASYETIKYFRILPEELSVSSETLTPTLKLKRRVVEKKYKHLLDEMYA